MSIQWFPGHMTKAKRAIIEQLKSVDMVIECRDARIPLASSNPMIDELIQNKPRLIVLTKRDLASEKITNDWIESYRGQGDLAISMNVHKDNVKRLINEGAKLAMKPKHERDAKRGIRPRITRALVVGVPNVGKSTLINRLAKRHVADVENRPGVTRSLKRIKISKELEVVDSPGLLWPRFEDPILGIHLALCDSIKETGFPINEVTDYGFEYLMNHRKDALLDRYQLDTIDTNIFYSHIAQLRGQAESSGRAIFLKDIQDHAFGPISWEKP